MIVFIFSSWFSVEGYGFEVGGGGCYIVIVINLVVFCGGFIDKFIGDFLNGLFIFEECYCYCYLCTRDKFVK